MLTKDMANFLSIFLSFLSPEIWIWRVAKLIVALIFWKKSAPRMPSAVHKNVFESMTWNWWWIIESLIRRSASHNPFVGIWGKRLELWRRRLPCPQERLWNYLFCRLNNIYLNVSVYRFPWIVFGRISLKCQYLGKYLRKDGVAEFSARIRVFCIICFSFISESFLIEWVTSLRVLIVIYFNETVPLNVSGFSASMTTNTCVFLIHRVLWVTAIWLIITLVVKSILSSLPLIGVTIGRVMVRIWICIIGSPCSIGIIGISAIMIWVLCVGPPIHWILLAVVIWIPFLLWW